MPNKPAKPVKPAKQPKFPSANSAYHDIKNRQKNLDDLMKEIDTPTQKKK